MLPDRKIISLALKTLQTEADALIQLKNKIGKSFADSVKLIFFSKGKVIVTGIGKSAIIAQKVVSTLNSTGTPSVFMHAADAVHGDLGIIQRDDIVLCISNSGNTSEIKVLVPLLKSSGNKLIAMAGDAASYLAKNADVVLNASVAHEACPMNLAPTSSTAVQMAIGDALAICLLECRGFTKEDFARYHPAGALGKKLYLKVADLYPGNPHPQVAPGDSIKKVIVEISSNRLGAAAVIKNNTLAGIVTDGDLRRMLEKRNSLDGLTAKDIMTSHPKTVEKNMMAIDALQIMKQHNITQVIVLDKGKYIGFVHLHDILREGII